MLKVGDSAPLFSLPDADMEVFSLAEQLGLNRVVLYFYPHDSSPVCTQLAEEFSDQETMFAKLDAIVAAVSLDDCVVHAHFRDENGVSMRLLSDEDGEVCSQFGVLQHREVGGRCRPSVARTTFILDKQGVIRHVLREITARAHVQDVLKRLKKLKT